MVNGQRYHFAVKILTPTRAFHPVWPIGPRMDARGVEAPPARTDHPGQVFFDLARPRRALGVP
jgi:hypothetical protein